MKVSYKWLQEYFDKPLPPAKELADLLNIRAFEVEDIEPHEDDSIFEIKITPDRAPDCLSHWGIAKEVSVHAKLPLLEKDTPQIEADFETAYGVEVQDGSCNRYMLREIRNVIVQDSPEDLKRKLESIGQRSINTIVDITNLVMFQIGQPLHAFDADKISGKTISVGEPKSANITTLDGKEIELTTEDLTIQDETGNLAIAGVKGGNRAEVNSYTTNILLEAANFIPVKVRKASKRTGIQNDSSKRFENGLTPRLAERAMSLASAYIKQYASSDETTFSNVLDTYSRPQPRPYTIGLDVARVGKKLGIEISEKEVLGMLSSYGISSTKVRIKEHALELAHGVIGKPYKWGASVLFDAPDAFDCSSLVSYVYSQSGVQLPRVSIDQFLFSSRIDETELEPGDLVFANTGLTLHAAPFYETKEFLKGTKIEHGVDHVGIYVGDGKVLHAGSNIGKVEIENINESTYFAEKIVGYGRVANSGDEKLVLEIPYERLDLKTEIDIIEEIGRTYGYEQIVPVAPTLSGQNAGTTTYDKIAAIKSHLTDLGFDEVVTYTFQKKGDVSVVKPLAKDKAYLRTDLSKGLTEALDLNFKNKELFAEDTVRIFEVGHVFVDDTEKTILAIAVRSVHKKNKPKTILEQVLSHLSEMMGVPISSSIGDAQEVVEIDLETLLATSADTYNSLYALGKSTYAPFSPYPFMTRDIAVWAKNTKTTNDIEGIIKSLATDLLVRFDLFDTYATEDRTSYAYRLVFQSAERTLTDDEINPIMDTIYETLKSDSDFEIR